MGRMPGVLCWVDVIVRNSLLTLARQDSSGRRVRWIDEIESQGCGFLVVCVRQMCQTKGVTGDVEKILVSHTELYRMSNLVNNQWSLH